MSGRRKTMKKVLLCLLVVSGLSTPACDEEATGPTGGPRQSAYLVEYRVWAIGTVQSVSATYTNDKGTNVTADITSTINPWKWRGTIEAGTTVILDVQALGGSSTTLMGFIDVEDVNWKNQSVTDTNPRISMSGKL
jgi:hypothetical protein